MTSPISWLSPNATQALGWALIHFVWQGVGVAALTAPLMSMSRRPGTRYGIGVAALALMMAMPVGDFLLFDNFAHPALSLSSVFTLPFAIKPGIMPWLVEAWLAGVAIFGLRFAGGILLLEQKRRQQSGVPGARVLALCREVQRLLGIQRAIGYLECGWVQVPSAIGWLRPVILLPAAALIGLTEMQLRAVIAHELAHVRRWDFLLNLIQIFAETLFFYHPALWWLNKRIRAERELCCDEIAVSVTGDRVEYAHALVQMAKLGSAPGFAMAATHGILSERIFHILGRGHEKPRMAGLAGSLVLLAASAAMAAVLLGPGASHSAVRAKVLAASTVVYAQPAPAAIHPAATPKDDDYVMPVRAGLSLIRTIERPKIAALSLPLVMVADMSDLPSPAPDALPIVAAVQSEAPPHPRSVVAQELAALDAPVNQYPAPVLKLNAEHGLDEWTSADATKYCQDYAVQTVAQGANMPLIVDGSMKQRLNFFYWHCMIANANGTIYAYGDGWGASPAYTAVGAASADHPVDVSGSWMMSVPPSAQANWAGMIAMQTQPKICNFIQSGNTISGTCTGPNDSGAVTGVIDGRQVRWVWKFPQDDGRHEAELDFLGLVGADGGMTGQSISFQFGGKLGAFMASPGPAQVLSQK